jgi:hypothetical protein
MDESAKWVETVMRPRVYFYHYNKPSSRAAKKPLMSVHFNKKCHIVDHVQCMVPCATFHRKIQPFCVMKGKCSSVVINRRDDGLMEAIIK